MTTWAVVNAPARLAARLGAFYAAAFLVVGIQLPFWPVWLAGRDLGARQIALVFAVAIWGGVFAVPMIGAAADRLGRRPVMIALAALAGAADLGLWPTSGFLPLLLLNLVASAALAALMPLADSITLAAAREVGLAYGRIRAWGSISFIVAALAGGGALARAPASLAGGNGVLLLVLAAAAVLFACCLFLPRTRRPAGRRLRRWAALGRLMRDKRFWLFLPSAATLQASHQVFYGFGTLYWRRLGFSDTAIGALWAEGVIAEIVLFWYGEPLLARLGPRGLMALGGAAGIVRWSLSGALPGLGAAAAVQLLHGFTFGASHLGAMHHLSRAAPSEAAASAQAIYTALSAALGGVVMLLAGALYGAYGGRAYLAMAGLSGLGLCGVLLLRERRFDDQEL